MNCEWAQQLIAADSETNEQTAREWESHVAACRECEQYAMELSEAQEWMRSFRREPIDKSVYRELRASVMAEVNRREASSGGWDWMWSVFGWKTAAAALALSCIVVGWVGAEYVRISRSPLVRPKIELPPPPDVSEIVKNWKLPKPSVPGPHGGRREGSDSASLDPNQFIASSTSVPVIWPETPLGEFDPGESLKNFSPAKHTTRIEIATADPSIRIIWFAPDKQ